MSATEPRPGRPTTGERRSGPGDGRLRERLDVRDAVFGGFDGTTSVVGVVAGLGVARSHPLLLASIGLAFSSAAGMAGGEWLSDKRRSRTAAITIGVATGVGTFLPVLPFVFGSGAAALGACAGIVVAVAATIAVLRGHTLRSWAQTFAVLGLAAGAAVGAAVLLGGAG